LTFLYDSSCPPPHIKPLLFPPELRKLATVIVQRGTLRPGSVVVAGSTYAKVRQLFDEGLRPVTVALPSTAVEVIGWKEQPRAGEVVLEAESEELAKTVVEFRERREGLDDEARARKLVQLRQLNNLEENEKERTFLLQQRRGFISKSEKFQRAGYAEEGGDTVKRFNTVVKGDVMGTVEAINSALGKLRNEELEVAAISSGVGAVTESDVELAAATNGNPFPFFRFFSQPLFLSSPLFVCLFVCFVFLFFFSSFFQLLLWRLI